MTFELTVTKTIPAPAKSVFEAWLNPEALARFMKPGPNMSDARVDVDPREGGAFEIIMIAGEAELPHRGEYKTIKRYERLAFSWLSGHAPEGSLVTIDFRAVSDNETELTLHHVGLPTEESRDNHNGGWTRIVEVATKVVS